MVGPVRLLRSEVDHVLILVHDVSLSFQRQRKSGASEVPWTRCRECGAGFAHLKDAYARGVRLQEASMLFTIFFILLILWALGMVSSYTLGGFIHILLVVAVVSLLIG